MRAALRSECAQALWRVRAKEEIVAQVIAGRMPLLEAAARFREVSGNPESGERVCRTVIGWAHLALRDHPERAERLSDHLEQELQAHLDRFGAVRLPGRDLASVK
jgi:hypothetical protein